MFRIDDATAATALPAPEAAGTEGYFTEGNPTAGTPATNVRGSWLNMIQEELRAIVVAGGLTPSKTTYNQVLSAIKRIGQNTIVLADTGAANAYTAVNDTPLVVGTWVDGVVQAVKIAHANTGASTYAPDGLAAIPIYGLGLQPLQGGELFLNGIAILMHATIVGVNSGNPIAVLLECTGGALQVGTATQSQHAATLGQVQSGSVGFGQSWQNVLGSRAANTTYYNTTGKTILVNITSSHSTAGNFTVLTINGTPVYGQGDYSLANNSTSYLWAVPAGASYVVTVTGGTLSVSQWTEYR